MRSAIQMYQELRSFFLHLRWHYQILLLSGGYILAGLFIEDLNFRNYWIQFFNVHLLLFGGATAFNSFWDKDEGPIGGLKYPPKMTPWMRPAAIVIMITSWMLAWEQSIFFHLFFGISFLLFWLYSTPMARWKSHPVLSIFVIFQSTGCGGFMLGILAGGGWLELSSLAGACGAGLVLISMYPVSQIFQQKEDKLRADQTFAIKYGSTGVYRFFVISFLAGLLLIGAGLYLIRPFWALLLSFSGLCGFFVVWFTLRKLKGESSEYAAVMKLKFTASFGFLFVLLIAHFVVHPII